MIRKYLFLLITGFIFGSQFLFTRYALAAYSPLDIGMIRIIIGMLAVSFLALFFTEHNPNIHIKWYHYALIGFLEGTLPCVLVPWGQQYMQTSVTSILISIMPIFSMVLGPLFISSEKYNAIDIGSILIGFIGVSIIINPSSSHNWEQGILPELAILLASASWALSLVLIKKLPKAEPVKLTRNILIAASIEIIPIWLWLGQPTHFHIVFVPFLYALMLGIFTSGIVYIFYVLLIRLSGVNFAAFSNYLVPIVGIILGIIFLNEKLTFNEIIGCIIVAIALLIQTGRDIRQRYNQ